MKILIVIAVAVVAFGLGYVTTKAIDPLPRCSQTLTSLTVIGENVKACYRERGIVVSSIDDLVDMGYLTQAEVYDAWGNRIVIHQDDGDMISIVSMPPHKNGVEYLITKNVACSGRRSKER